MTHVITSVGPLTRTQVSRFDNVPSGQVKRYQYPELTGNPVTPAMPKQDIELMTSGKFYRENT